MEQLSRKEIKEIIEGVMDIKLKDLKSDMAVVKQQNGEMWDIFSNAKGFGDIVVTLLKALVLFGAATAVVGGAYEALKLWVKQ